MLRKSEVTGVSTGGRNDGHGEHLDPLRQVRRVKGGYKFRWLIRQEIDVKQIMASSCVWWAR
jgi:hypothetical protein